jgi:hypothetical protein
MRLFVTLKMIRQAFFNPGASLRAQRLVLAGILPGSRANLPVALPEADPQFGERSRELSSTAPASNDAGN